MNVLVFNVGSTTLKYACIDPETGQRLAAGIIDRIGQPDQTDPAASDHMTAARFVLEILREIPFAAIGHRIVHGGAIFQQPTAVTPEVLQRLKTLDSLAPLHNPPARSVVQSLVDFGVPQTLVFDTAWFSTLDETAWRYALPEAWYRDYGVRRYGFHGTSHEFVTNAAMRFLEHHDEASDSFSAERCKMITLHLGGGVSASASIGGVAVDTTMGMTPLEGLVMATRCGDIDPAIPLHLMQHHGLSMEQIEHGMIRSGGLLGLCGHADMRKVLEAASNGDQAAETAVNVFVRKIVKTVGGFFAILGGLDTLVFTAGIGQHSSEIRQRVTDALSHLGIRIQSDLNADCSGDMIDISDEAATVRTLVVATDEELAIARQILR